MNTRPLLTGFAALLLSACSPAPDGDVAAPFSSTDQIHLNPGSQNLNDYFECLENEKVTLVSAHRGGSFQFYPENSLQTMQYVTDQIPALLEIDIAATKDNKLILMHDDTLARTTTGTGMVDDRLSSDIAALHLVDAYNHITDYSVPYFEDVLRWADGKTILQLDIKKSVRYKDLVSIVKKHRATNRILYIAYSVGQARAIHRLHPEAMISVTVTSPNDLKDIAEADIPDNRIFAWTGNTQINPSLYSALNAENIEVIFGTLGGKDSIDKNIARTNNNSLYSDYAATGIDIIATDRPLVAASALDVEKMQAAVKKCNG
ncbi:MAG: glycerophosphodiester phosphodiesterase family protein [bacterium]